MKFLVLLLSIYVIGLSFIPCENEDFCCAGESTHGLEQHGESGHDAAHPRCPCSPFFACGGCVGIILSSTTIDFVIKQVQVALECPPYQNTELHTPLQSVWQPPKSV